MKTLMFIFMQKIKYITHLLLETLLRHRKLVVLSTLSIPGNVHQTKKYQRVGKNQLDPFFFLEILHFKKSCNLIGSVHFHP